MIVLDTNVVSEIIKLNCDPGVARWAKFLETPTLLTAITVAEMRLGIAQMPEGRRKRDVSASVEKVIAGYCAMGRVLPFDEKCTTFFAQITLAQQKAGRQIEVEDAQIAAICLAHGYALATRNEKDFTETGLEIINPWLEN